MENIWGPDRGEFVRAEGSTPFYGLDGPARTGRTLEPTGPARGVGHGRGGLAVPSSGNSRGAFHPRSPRHPAISSTVPPSSGWGSCRHPRSVLNCDGPVRRPVGGQWRVAGRGTGRRVSRPDPSDAYPERGSPMENETPPGAALSARAAKPHMEGSTVLGVVGGTPEQPRLAYLAEPRPVTEELLALSVPVLPTAVFRFEDASRGPCLPAGQRSGLSPRHADRPVAAPGRGRVARVPSPAALPLVAAGGQSGLLPLPAGRDGREPSLRTLSKGCRS